MHLVHCSYHKCLTQYFAAVMRQLLNARRNRTDGYKHFKSEVNDFYRETDQFLVSSVNNHALDLNRLGDCRVSRFVRDPRDLFVSGYFYHRRGAEYWCDLPRPTLEAWSVVNGNLPAMLGQDESFSSCLRRLSIEDGLIAEIEFRKFHFESMLQWPDHDTRIRVFRYEELVGCEAEVFSEIFSFFGFSASDRSEGVQIAKNLSAGKVADASDHIRDPRPAQWKEYFTPQVNRYFLERYEELLFKYRYH